MPAGGKRTGRDWPAAISSDALSTACPSIRLPVASEEISSEQTIGTPLWSYVPRTRRIGHGQAQEDLADNRQLDRTRSSQSRPAAVFSQRKEQGRGDDRHSMYGP